MTTQERRQHFRIDDSIYFDYRVLSPGEISFDNSINNQLLGANGQQFMEFMQYFDIIDKQIESLHDKLHARDPALFQYLSLLNNKIDFISRQICMTDKVPQRPVNLSLGGMSFKTTEKLKDKAALKIVIYTKPKMIPIIVDARVVYSQLESEYDFKTVVEFYELNIEHEQLLAQHIMLAQLKNTKDCIVI